MLKVELVEVWVWSFRVYAFLGPVGVDFLASRIFDCS